MGRQHFLTRLALGRSAYEDSATAQHRACESSSQDGVGVQEYDSKGRPVDRRTKALDAEMRKAQNEVLELVGVVEREDHADRLQMLRSRRNGEACRIDLIQERGLGELLHVAIGPIKSLSRLWFVACIERIQAGIHSPQQPMSDIIAQCCMSLHEDSVQNCLAVLFPGIAEVLVHFAIELPFVNGVRQFVGRLQTYANSVLSRRRSRQIALYATKVLEEILLITIDVILSPVQIYAFSQRLGLAPCFPIIPPLELIRSLSSTCFRRSWRHRESDLALDRTHALPLVLLLISKYARRASENDRSVSRTFADPRLPEPIDPPNFAPPSGSDHNSLYVHPTSATWLSRCWVMRTLGSSLWQPCTEIMYGNGLRLIDLGSHPHPGHQSTAFARFPARLLVEISNSFFVQVLVVSWHSLVVRTIAMTYASSSLSRSSIPLETIYNPFGGGPVARLFRAPLSRSSWSEAVQYTNKLCLALALGCAWNIVVFAGGCGVTYLVGVARLGWGRRRWMEG